LQLNRSIQYNDKSNSNTTQQSITEITNACKILCTYFVKQSEHRGISTCCNAV